MEEIAVDLSWIHNTAQNVNVLNEKGKARIQRHHLEDEKEKESPNILCILSQSLWIDLFFFVIIEFWYPKYTKPARTHSIHAVSDYKKRWSKVSAGVS